MVWTMTIVIASGAAWGLIALFFGLKMGDKKEVLDRKSNLLEFLG